MLQYPLFAPQLPCSIPAAIDYTASLIALQLFQSVKSILVDYTNKLSFHININDINSIQRHLAV